jgi:hypothetical protein
LPQHGGGLSAGDDLWEFEKHGKGVRFNRVLTGEIVDVPTALVTCPKGLDSWRLVEHLDSKMDISLQYGGVEFDGSSQVSLERLLQQLCRDGILSVAVQSDGGQLYVFSRLSASKAGN